MSLQPRFSMCLAVGILLAAVASVNAEDKFGMALKLDHFWIYSTKPAESPARSVSVQGQFDRNSIPVRLTTINYFANPVSKDKGELINPMAHLTWYKLAQRQRQPKIAVEFENQFGRQEMLLGNAVALLVPTEKVEKGSKAPVGLDHFKVYQVLEARPLEKKVTLMDQFGSQDSVQIQKTAFFCVPVTKSHDDKVTKITNEKGHLTIYSAQPATKYGKTQGTVDQFGKHTLAINQTEMLAVPTIKIAWKAIED